MNPRKQSFLERLTGTQSIIEDEFLDEELPESRWTDEEENDENIDAGLPIDMYETDTELVIQSMIAGVTPENLHISITNNTVTIKGKRVPKDEIPSNHYLEQELYWGTFSRDIELPYEVDTENADAIEKYGLLVIRLPRMDKNRPQVLKVKSVS